MPATRDPEAAGIKDANRFVLYGASPRGTIGMIEAGRALTYAAWLTYQAGDEAVREVSMVKLFTAEMVQKVVYDCVQLHGGYGYMRETLVERLYRDARLYPIGGGTREIMNEVIAKVEGY